MFACWPWRKRATGGDGDDGVELCESSASAAFSDDDCAVLELKVARDQQQRYAAHCDAQAEAAKQLAQRFFDRGQRRRAAQALQCKMGHERASRTAHSYVQQLEQLIAGVHDAVQARAIVAALQLGNETMQRLNAELSAADTAAVMDEVRETLAETSALHGDVATAMQLPDEHDDAAELDAELAQLEQQMTRMLAETALLRQLPPVPTTPLPTPTAPQGAAYAKPLRAMLLA